MGRDSANLKRKIVIMTTVLFFLAVMGLATASLIPLTKGAGASLVVSPSSGKQGSLASIVGTGFNPGTQMVLLCGSTNLGSFTASPEGRVDTTFTVRVPPGTYNIVARDGSTVFATTTYTVIEEPKPTTSSGTQTTPIPTSPAYSSTPFYPLSTSTWFYPYATVTPRTAETGIPTTVIAAIAVIAIVAVISVTYFVRRRGGPEPSYEESAETISPPPTQYPRTQRPTVSRYNQAPTYSQYSSRSTVASRSNMSSRYGQSATLTRVCPRCRRSVRTDYSICPHCNQRLK